ncbi:MAG: threonine 3-dehydrogenase [Clostridiales bacterium]|jgi:threonine 3-dehydrogenase|nr:threonine 3-dehydrogenase [Clostridiales bacterium]
MKKMMKAIIKREPGVGAEVAEVPVPEIGKEEVLVKVAATAVCGTDMHIYDWNNWAQNAGISLPVIMGHEFCGEVEAVGENVKDIKVGDFVAGETHIPCGTCYQCQNGQQHICGNLTIFGVHTDGCFAEYTKIPAICARKIPTVIPTKYGAVLEPLGTSLRACLETDVAGKKTVIIGCGSIGLFALASAKALGASEIIAIDVSDDRLGIADRIGATLTINSLNADVVKTVLEKTNGVGADVVIDASGNAGAIQQGFKFLRKGGEVALIGLPSKPVALDLGPDVVFKEAKITGIHGREMFKTWIHMENLLSKDMLDIGPVITHQMALDEFETAIELLKSGRGTKIVLNP